MKGLWDGDARLVRAVLAGDEAAWQRFILRFANFIYRAIIPYTDDYDEKMTVFLHVLEKLREDGFARLRRFAFRSKLSTWLTVVARRLALDLLRSRHGRDFSRKRIRVVSIDGDPALSRLLAAAGTPETELAAGEKRERRHELEDSLRRALARLDERERLAVQLVFFQGMRINETGRLLGVSAAYKFLERILKKIRREMEGEGRIVPGDVAEALEGEAHE